MNTAGRPAVAIGGVGGSGTRVVAEMLRGLGYHIGDDLNEASDNLWFTLLFKYREVLALDDSEFAQRYTLFRSRMNGASPGIRDSLAVELLEAERCGQHPADWLRSRLGSFVAGPSPRPERWGWKEPNTHVLLDRLLPLEPGLRYVHVMRNGLDMALSQNQNQLRLWGPGVLGEHFSDDARGSLAYWCWAHRRVLERGQRMGERFLLVNFDALCVDPLPQLGRLLAFLGHEAAPGVVDRLAAGVRAPSSLNRHRSLSIDAFDAEDVAFVRSLGFELAMERGQ